MTSTISYNLAQLDQFRSAAGSEAGRFGALGDALDLSPSASIFGHNGGAAALSSAIASMGNQLQQEFAKAETLLRDVSRSIDAVQSAIETADRNGKRTFTPTSPASAGGGGSGGSGGSIATAPASADPNVGTAPPVKFGDGVTINLPHGLGSVEAPNAKAAGAVREALTQLGVPYIWGGETQGKGFDCSGLTQWAYGKEGISLPHDAAAQNIGERVAQSNLAPGDLAVWDGHVAMYIGNDQMIEAPRTGDVVHLVPVRTSNAGDAFEGFYRPTA
ncbi:MAG: peptidoglycan DL-endopeptidase CwlO [Gaiellales bacterium]|nr:peptidoglycan DL-endopeptidase CwlO [Gaiellales bacterium]